VFNIDLKKAETALNAGRLDEACSMLTSTPKRFHADGQRLVDRLVAALLERGSAHYQQLRYVAARNDAALAKQLGGPQVEVEQLLQQVDARDQSFVQKTTEQNENEFIDRLTELVEARKFDQAARLIASALHSASGRISSNPDVQRLTALVGEAIRKQIDSDFRIGRLDKAIVSLATLERAGMEDRETIALRSQIGQLSQIVNDARDADYTLALRKLKLQQQVFPDAKWIGQAITATEKCIAAVEEIFSGPLGFVDDDKHPAIAQTDGPMTNPYIGSGKLPSPRRSTLLHVDQLGSLLVLAAPQITIGTTSSYGSGDGGAADVVLQTEGGGVITIQRSGEDYLAQSSEPFVVSGRSSRQHLLSNGDTIEVGKRGRLKFLRSVSASDSAVLRITGSKMKQRQIRSIVLMGDSLVFGPTSGHFRLANLRNRVIMRPLVGEDAFMIHQQGRAEPQSLTSGAAASFDGCQFLLEVTDVGSANQRSVS
jgi:hypothetical protein